MFDYFCIFTTGGVVLWYKAFIDIKFDLINQLIKDIMIEEKTAKDQFIHKGSVVKWRVANELNIVFTVVYKEILHLAQVDELLEMIKTTFIKKVVPNLDLDNGLYITLPTYFDKYFKNVQQKWELMANENKSPKKMRTFNDSKKAKKGSQGDGTPTASTPKGSQKSEDEDEGDQDEEVEEQDESKMTKTELARKRLAEKFKKKKSKTIKKKQSENKEETKGKGKEARLWGFKNKITEEDMKLIDRYVSSKICHFRS